MRASARPFAPRPFFWAAGLLALTAGFSACADSIQLVPPDGGTGTSTGTSSGTSSTTTAQGGSGGSGECTSNKDCAYPEPVCDTVKQKCLECVSHGDCLLKPGTVCSAGSCVCPTAAGAAKEDFCPAVNQTPDRCVDLQTSAADCGGCGHACFGECKAGACNGKWSRIATPSVIEGRSHHVAVAAGSKMIVWGGTRAFGQPTDTGAVYDPATDGWKAMSYIGAPSPRHDATAVWDGVRGVMIVWGGLDANNQPLGDGGRYDLATDTWSPMTKVTAPSPRSGHTAVLGTAGMVVWGGKGTKATDIYDDGATYDPVKDVWTTLVPNNGLSKRAYHTAVWLSTFTSSGSVTGPSMVVFGGIGPDTADPTQNVEFADGYSVDALGTWKPLVTPTISITARSRHTAVATDKGMVVWGGVNGTSVLSDGGLMDDKQAWTATGPASTLEGRTGHSAVAIGSKVVVFGGAGDAAGKAYLDSTWMLDAGSLAWTQISDPGPSRRAFHSAVAVGTKMIVFGGEGPSGVLADGASFDAGQ